MINRIAEYIKDNDGFTILTHVAPDGDTLGSGVALYSALLGMGKKASLRNPSTLPGMYTFLPHYEQFNKGSTYSNVIALDCADVGRMSHCAVLFERAKFSIMIDHHATNAGAGDLCIVSPQASSVGEMVYELVQALRCPMTNDIATGLYTAITTDTGNFTYSNTTRKCMEYCAQMLDYIDVTQLTRLIFRTRTYTKTQLIERFIANIELSAGGRIAVSHLLVEDLKRIGTSAVETDSIVDFARDIDTVEAAAFVMELKPQQYKVGLRSKDHVDVSEVAARHGGGGHQRAAGCWLYGELSDVRAQIARELEELLP